MTTPAKDVHERLKTNGTAIKIAKRLLTINNKRKIIRWNKYRDNNIHSRRQILKCLWKSLFCFKPAYRCLLFSKMNSKQENRSKLSFTARIITKYSLERFVSICGEKMSEGFLKFYKLIIKPDTQIRFDYCQIIVSNLTNVHKLNSHINYARLHYIRYKKTNTKYINYSGLPFEMHWKLSSKPRIASDFNPLTHQARWKTKTMPSEIGFSPLTSDVFLNQNPYKQTSCE